MKTTEHCVLRTSWCAVLCCGVLCCAVVCCGVLCCAVVCCAVLRKCYLSGERVVTLWVGGIDTGFWWGSELSY
jgi:hypothetical protein